MGHISDHGPVLLLLATFSQQTAALRWAREQATLAWGPVALESPEFDFTETDYYHATMGSPLTKTFYAFEQLVDPSVLADRKLQTNQWERTYAEIVRDRALDALPVRPLNLDPGYVTSAKLVLASTKDHAHRIYIGQGIYAELTLQYRKRTWQTLDWTYPDYRRRDYGEFFTLCREYLRGRAKEEGKSGIVE